MLLPRKIVKGEWQAGGSRGQVREFILLSSLGIDQFLQESIIIFQTQSSSSGRELIQLLESLVRKNPIAPTYYLTAYCQCVTGRFLCREKENACMSGQWLRENKVLNGIDNWFFGSHMLGNYLESLRNNPIEMLQKLK